MNQGGVDMKFAMHAARLSSFAAVLITCGVAMTSATADVRVVYAVQADMSKVAGSALTMDELAVLARNGSGLATLYIKGSGVRLDEPNMSLVTDAVAGTTMFIDAKSRCYATQSLKVQAYNKTVAAMTVVSKKLASTQDILGHVCVGYDVTVTNGTETTESVLWVATDLPGIPSGVILAEPGIDVARSKVGGLPLKITSVMKGPAVAGGQVGWSEVATSVSTAQLPSSLFSVPTGYKLALP